MATNKKRGLTRRVFLSRFGIAAAGLAVPARKPLYAAAVQPSRKQILILAGRETNSFGTHGRTDTEQQVMVDAGLAGQNPATLERFPWLVEDLPSVKKGTWKIDYQKKTMVTVYRLRSGLRWHDGKPYTSQDFRFGWEVHRHPDFPIRETLVPSLMEKVETPDERTIVIHWNKLYNEANTLYKVVRAWPRHILEDTFRAGDMKALARHPYWNRQFIGMGPYRLADWGGGKQIVLEANPYYALGTPKIDRVVWRIVEDSNAGLSSVLAGEPDLTLRQALSLDGAMVLKEQWEAHDKGRVLITPVTFRWLNLSGNNPLFNDVRVRRALLHAIDREGLVKTIFKGLVPVNYFPLSPARKSYKRADAAAAKYEYNVTKARQLLADAGWKPGADGILANTRGERMEFEFRAEAGNRTDEQTQAVIIDAWKKLGIQCKANNMPQRLLNSEEYRNRWPGAALGGMSSAVEEWVERFHSSYTPTEENRYATQAVSLWRNAQADAIMDQLNSIISDDREVELQVEFVKLYTRDLPYLPLYYTPEILAVKKGVSGITPRIETGGANANTWNIHLWDRA